MVVLCKNNTQCHYLESLDILLKHQQQYPKENFSSTLTLITDFLDNIKDINDTTLIKYEDFTDFLLSSNQKNPNSFQGVTEKVTSGWKKNFFHLNFFGKRTSSIKVFNLITLKNDLFDLTQTELNSDYIILDQYIFSIHELLQIYLMTPDPLIEIHNPHTSKCFSKTAHEEFLKKIQPHLLKPKEKNQNAAEIKYKIAIEQVREQKVIYTLECNPEEYLSIQNILWGRYLPETNFCVIKSESMKHRKSLASKRPLFLSPKLKHAARLSKRA